MLAASPSALSDDVAAERAGIQVAVVYADVGKIRKEELRKVRVGNFRIACRKTQSCLVQPGPCKNPANGCSCRFSIFIFKVSIDENILNPFGGLGRILVRRFVNDARRIEDRYVGEEAFLQKSAVS